MGIDCYLKINLLRTPYAIDIFRAGDYFEEFFLVILSAAVYVDLSFFTEYLDSHPSKISGSFNLA